MLEAIIIKKTYRLDINPNLVRELTEAYCRKCGGKKFQLFYAAVGNGNFNGLERSSALCVDCGEEVDMHQMNETDWNLIKS